MGGEGLDTLSQDYPPVLVCCHGNRAVADKLLPWQYIRMLFIPHLYSGDPEKATIELLHNYGFGSLTLVPWGEICLS